MIRRTAKTIAGWFLRQVYFRLFPLTGSCVVLMFHRVLPPSAITPWNEDLAISTTKFTWMLRKLRAHLTPVDLYDWIQHPRAKEDAFAVSFDDGWRDNFEHALPILDAAAVSATIFVTAGMIGTNRQFWFERLSVIARTVDLAEIARAFPSELEGLAAHPDRLAIYDRLVRALKRLPLTDIESRLDAVEARLGLGGEHERAILTWDELRVMSRSAFSVGSHGMNHAILTPLTSAEKRFELTESSKVLLAQGVRYVPIMSFPNGFYDQETIDLCRAAGYEVMVTASIQQIGTGTGGLMVYRIAVNQTTSLNSLFLSIFKAVRRGKVLRVEQAEASRMPSRQAS